MSAAVGPTVPRRSPKSAAFSDHQIRQVANGSSEAIARWAEATAKERASSPHSPEVFSRFTISDNGTSDLSIENWSAPVI